MFRIRTKLNNKEVFTLYFDIIKEWITIIKLTVENKTTVTSTEATNPFDAGQNHLRGCK